MSRSGAKALAHDTRDVQTVGGRPGIERPGVAPPLLKLLEARFTSTRIDCLKISMARLSIATSSAVLSLVIHQGYVPPSP